MGYLGTGKMLVAEGLRRRHPIVNNSFGDTFLSIENESLGVRIKQKNKSPASPGFLLFYNCFFNTIPFSVTNLFFLIFRVLFLCNNACCSSIKKSLTIALFLF